MTDSPVSHRRELLARAVRYLVVGGSNTLITYAIFLGLSLVIPVWLAYTVAYLIGLAWNVFGSARFVFRAKSGPKKLAQFAGFSVAIYLCGRAVIWMCAPRTFGSLVLTTLLVLVITTPMSFLAGAFIFDRRLLRRPVSDDRSTQ